MSYYKQIDGVTYDRALIEAAKEAVSGRGDGRISKADAEKLLTFVIDGNTITATEQATIIYLRDNFTWTDKADAWFKDAITRWEAGDRSFSAKPAASTAAPKTTTEPAVLVRIGSEYKAASYFPADAAAEAKGGAIIILSRVPGSTELSKVWANTEPHKTADLSDAVETALCNTGTAIVRANLWRFSRVLGTHRGMISWQSGFTNVPADTIAAELKRMGFDVIEADTLL